MTTPKENFNLVGIYQNISQYSIACDLLDKGLNDETIESTPQNWQALGGWYQLIHRDDKAIQTFMTAAKLFPTDAEIEYQLAQVYLGISDEKDAFEHIKLCIAKGGTAKPHVGLLLYAYTAMDLQKFDEALKGADEAEAAAKKANAPEAVKQAATIREAVRGNLQDRANRTQQMHR
jgi:tetratricopeptide (TPR) repeat protein